MASSAASKPAHWELPVLLVLQGYAQLNLVGKQEERGIRVDEWLMNKTGAPEKVVYRAMLKADRAGLVDYGVSLRYGWLTDKGKLVMSLLKPLKRVSND